MSAQSDTGANPALVAPSKDGLAAQRGRIPNVHVTRNTARSHVLSIGTVGYARAQRWHAVLRVASHGEKNTKNQINP